MTATDTDGVVHRAAPAPLQREGRLALPAPSVRATGLLLALALCALYALTSAGGFVSFDGQVMYNTAAAIVDRHTLALPPHHHGMPGVNGGFYSKYGIAQSLAEIPFYVIGGALAPHFAGQLGPTVAIAVTLLTNSVVTALAALLFFLLVHELGATRRAALAAALLIGVASPYWPYAKTDFSEPLSALALTGAVLFLVRARARRGATPYVVSGLFIALAVLTKLTVLFALPALGIYALYVAWLSEANGRAVAARLYAWGIPVVAGLAAAAIYNLARYGRLTDTGYRSPDDLPFHAPLLRGLEGLLVSSGKGLLWYCPLVVLALALWPLLLRRRRAEGLLALGIVFPTLIVFATYPVWWGGHCWGPRYLLPLLPLILLPLALIPEALAWRAMARRAAVTLVALSVMAQALGVSVHVERFLQTGFADAHERQGLWIARDSPLLGHAWLLAYDMARAGAPGVAARMLAGYPWRHTAGTSLSQRRVITRWDYWWWQAVGRYGLAPPVQILIALLLLAGLLAALWRLRLPGVVWARAPGFQRADEIGGAPASSRSRYD